jgi:hypothetical protein
LLETWASSGETHENIKSAIFAATAEFKRGENRGAFMIRTVTACPAKRKGVAHGLIHAA